MPYGDAPSLIILHPSQTSLHHNLTLPPSLLEGDHLKLFVAETHSESVASADTAKAAVNGHHDASRSERVEWALDHGFEYLEVCADSDAELTKSALAGSRTSILRMTND